MSFLICLCRTITVLTLLGFVSGCSTSLSAAQAPPTETDRLIAHAEFVHRAAAQHADIWADFWHPQQGFILHIRQGPALLYTHGAPLPGADQVAPNTYIYPHGLDRLTDAIYLRYPLPDTTVTAVALQSRGSHTAGLLFHEAFHAYQSSHFEQSMAARFVSDEAFAEPHVRALLQMRREVLKAGLAQAKAQAPITTAGALLSIDRALQDSVAAPVMERLYQLELIEGSAELVGLRAQLLSLPTLPSSPRSVDLQASLIASLETRLARPSGSIQSASDLRFYAYGTGAASSFLLAHMRADYQQVLAGNLVDQQILSLLPSLGDVPSLAQIYDDFGYADWLDWADDEAPTNGHLSVSRFAALTPATLDIAIELHSASAAAALNVNFSSGIQGFSQPKEGSYMLPEPLSVSIHGAMTSLLIEEAATHLMSPQADAPVLRVHVKVDSLPALCAHNPDGTRILSCELESLSLNWQGVQLEHQATTRIQQRGQFLHIDIHEH